MLAPSPNIRSTVNSDGGVLLDLQTGRCLTLNPVGGQVWRTLEQHPEGLTVDHLVDKLIPLFEGLERNTLRNDMEVFLSELESKRLILNGNNASSFSNIRNTLPRFEQAMTAPPFDRNDSNEVNAQTHIKDDPHMSIDASSFLCSLVAMAALVGVDIILKIAGFPVLYKIISRWPTHRFLAPSQLSIARICASVDTACRYYFKRTLCLQRSVVTTCLLRLAGNPAKMVIAAHVMPFHGHAWVEIDGVVVNDSDNVQKFYSVLDRC